MRLLLLGLLVIALRPHPAAGQAAPLVMDTRGWQQRERAQEFVGEWEYRFGDSPRDPDGALRWSREPPSAAPRAADPGWIALGRRAIPSPPGHRGQRFMWLRTKLYGPAVEQPVLYIGPVHELFEAFVDGQPLYRFGQIDGDGRQARRFAGYPMHFIPLPPDYQGKTLTLRCYSKATTIGVGSRQRIGSKVAIIADILRSDLSYAWIGAILCTIGGFVFALFLFERKERAYFYYAGFALTAGVWILCQMRTRNLLIDTPLAWTHIEYFALYSAAGFLGIFLVSILGNGLFGLMPLVALVLALNPLVLALLLATGVLSIMKTLVVFEMEMLPLVAYMLLSIGSLLRQGNSDARLFSLGFSMAMLMGLCDLMMSLGILPRTSAILSPIGQGLFVLMLGLTLIVRFRRTHIDLGKAKQALSEQLVALAARNTEIEHLNDEMRHQIAVRSKQMINTFMDTSETAPEAVPLLTPGTLINKRYRVIRTIGHGAMGVVYQVERVRDGRPFAAKVLSYRGRRKELARFAREAQLLAQLKHENLVTIADVDITEDRLAYIIMELIEGTTLKDQSAHFTELSFAVPVLRQLARALATVHENGIVHRDLKPANVLLAVGASGQHLVKLADFGISILSEEAQSGEPPPRPEAASGLSSSAVLSQQAPEPADEGATGERPPARPGSTSVPPHQDLDTFSKTIDVPSPAVGETPGAMQAAAIAAADLSVTSEDRDADGRVTATGVLIGTPMYMAPELAAGSRSARPSADIFALGVVAYEILTGEMPYPVPVIWQKPAGDILALLPLRERNLGLAESVVTLLDRCLHRDPLYRPTAGELYAALAAH